MAPTHLSRPSGSFTYAIHLPDLTRTQWTRVAGWPSSHTGLSYTGSGVNTSSSCRLPSVREVGGQLADLWITHRDPDVATGQTVGKFQAMPGSVARLPVGQGDGGLPPIEVYKAAIDEYRFQARFNWSRTQYMLAFNVGILAAGVAVASRFGDMAVLVFAVGAVASGMSAVMVRTQHDYYRAARDRMRRIEQDFGIPSDQRIDTTSTLGDRHRTISVTQIVYLLYGALLLADLSGIGFTLHH